MPAGQRSRAYSLISQAPVLHVSKFLLPILPQAIRGILSRITGKDHPWIPFGPSFDTIGATTETLGGVANAGSTIVALIATV